MDFSNNLQFKRSILHEFKMNINKIVMIQYLTECEFEFVIETFCKEITLST